MRSSYHPLLTQHALDQTTRRPAAARRTRRDAFRLVGGAGLAGAGIVSAGLLPWRRRGVGAQEGGTPAPAATPRVGRRGDGSTLWRVKVGYMDMEDLTEFHAFFPGELTITPGDAVWFDFGMMAGFHTVSFLSGGEIPPLLIPDPEVATSAADADAPPKLILHPEIVFPVGGDRYDGTGYVNSGIDVFRDPSQPFVLAFTEPGTYEYLCQTHLGLMKARVIVAAGATAARTPTEIDRVVQDEIAKLQDQAAADLAAIDQSVRVANADGTTTWEVAIGAGGASQVRIQSFLPKELEIGVGDTIRWVHRVPGEPHTVSFIGAGEAPPEDILIEQFADGTPKVVQSMLTLTPQGGNVWSGRGWLNSGFMGVPDSPTEFAVTFDTPGDYTYFCILHGDAEGNRMAARLKVAPK